MFEVDQGERKQIGTGTTETIFLRIKDPGH